MKINFCDASHSLRLEHTGTQTQTNIDRLNKIDTHTATNTHTGTKHTFMEYHDDG